jgi:hypothetical protein
MNMFFLNDHFEENISLRFELRKLHDIWPQFFRETGKDDGRENEERMRILKFFIMQFIRLSLVKNRQVLSDALMIATSYWLTTSYAIFGKVIVF